MKKDNVLNKIAALIGLSSELESKRVLKLEDETEIHLTSDDFEGSIAFYVKEGENVLLSNGEYTLEDGTEFSINEGVISKESKIDHSEIVEKAADLLSKVEKEKDEEINALKADLEAAQEKAKEVKAKPAGTNKTTSLASIQDSKLVPTKLKGTTEEIVKSMAFHILSKQGYQARLAAGDVNITTTYAGEAAAGYIAPALLAGRTLNERNITVFERLTNKLVINRVNTSGSVVKAATCDFTVGGEVDLDERVLDKTEIEINMEMCKNDFIDYWSAREMTGSAHNKYPNVFMNNFILHLAAKMAQTVEQNIWNGNSGFASAPTLFTGIVKHLIDDAGAPDAGTWTAGTSDTAANIVASLRTLIAAIPEEILDYDDLRIYLPRKAALSYVQALGDSGYGDVYQVGDKPLNVDGIQIAVAPGTKVPVATRISNIAFGCDLLSDNNMVKVLDMEDRTGDSNIRAIMKAGAGTQVVYPAETASFQTLA